MGRFFYFRGFPQSTDQKLAITPSNLRKSTQKNTIGMGGMSINAIR
ncbi:MAG: hypothetical protein KKA81_17290 [Bacteroidetes bacterium]|nr:hypothetical protein [Bacteroidota bacterium]